MLGSVFPPCGLSAQPNSEALSSQNIGAPFLIVPCLCHLRAVSKHCMRDAAQHRQKLCQGHAHKEAAWTGKCPLALPLLVCRRGKAKAHKLSEDHSYYPKGLGVTRIKTACTSDLTMCMPWDFYIFNHQTLLVVQLGQYTYRCTCFSQIRA